MRFRESLSRPGVNIIAEFKRASPSMGVIDALADPAERARQYEQGGAAAMSVLCDAERFSGSVADLRKARGATSIPGAFQEAQGNQEKPDPLSRPAPWDKVP